MNNIPPPILVQNQQNLEALVIKLNSSPIVAVDTESDSLFAYREKVCLIQFSIPDGDYLVDPLAIKELSCLSNIFSNPKIEVIFHAAEYDLLVLKRDYQFAFENIFDTMIAARILGKDKVGLGNILKGEFNIHLEKKFQRANWAKRPLPKPMQDYARFDTHFLIKLRDHYKKQLIAFDKWDLAQEDFKRMCHVNGKIPGPIVTNIWRINGVKQLTGNQAAVMQKLANYRQGIAEKLDIPLFKIIGDKTLVRIAEVLPRTERDLYLDVGFTENQLRRHKKGVLRAVEEGLKSPPLSRPRSTERRNYEFDARVDTLKKWRRQTAEIFNVESDVILPKDILGKIALQHPNSIEDLKQVMELVPYRFNQYGENILKVIRK
jgi:ribonuclease D